MAAIERFVASGDDPVSPARIAFAITAHDSNELTYITKAIYVGTSGDLAVTMFNGETVTFANVPAGSVLPVMARLVKSTNTTASDIVGLA